MMRFKPPVKIKKQECDICGKKRYLRYKEDEDGKVGNVQVCEACYYGPVHIKKVRTIGRNDDCPCGKTRKVNGEDVPVKYKKCCMPVYIPIE